MVKFSLLKHNPASIAYANSPYSCPSNISWVDVTTTGGNVVVTLPDAALKKRIGIAKITSDAYLVDIRNASGTTLAFLSDLNETCILESDGSTWDISYQKSIMPYDAIVFQVGTIGSGGVTIAKNKYGRIISKTASGVDDTAVIEAAMAVISSGTLRIGPGSYKGTIDLRNRLISIEGAGISLTTLDGMGADRVIDMRNSALVTQRETQRVSNLSIENGDVGIGLDIDWAPFESIIAKNIHITDCDYGINLGHGTYFFEQVHIGSCDLAAVYGDIVVSDGWGATATFRGGEWGDYGDYGLDIIGAVQVYLYDVYCEGHDISEARVRRNDTTDSRASLKAFNCGFEDSHNTGPMIEISKNSASNCVGMFGNVIKNCIFTTSQSSIVAIDIKADGGYSYSFNNLIESNWFGGAGGYDFTIHSNGANPIRHNRIIRNWGDTLTIDGTGATGENCNDNYGAAFDVFSPTGVFVGGSATTSDLTLKTTSGNGVSGADMHFLVGNNGSIEALTITNEGQVQAKVDSASTTTQNALVLWNIHNANVQNGVGLKFKSQMSAWPDEWFNTGRILSHFNSNLWTGGTTKIQTPTGTDAWVDAVLFRNGQAGFGSPDGSGDIIPASAKVEIVSTTQGFLPPRMTNTEMNAISSPAEGLVVYDTTLHALCFYNGSAWKTIAVVT